MPGSVVGALGTGSCKHGPASRRAPSFSCEEEGDPWWREVRCSRSERRTRAEPESGQTHRPRSCPGPWAQPAGAWGRRWPRSGAHRGLSAGLGAQGPLSATRAAWGLHPQHPMSRPGTAGRRPSLPVSGPQPLTPAGGQPGAQTGGRPASTREPGSCQVHTVRRAHSF